MRRKERLSLTLAENGPLAETTSRLGRTTRHVDLGEADDLLLTLNFQLHLH